MIFEWLLPILVWNELRPDLRLAKVLKERLQLGTSRRLFQAVLANEPKRVERLLAQGAQLRGRDWHGQFTLLHAAALSNCWQALPPLLAAAAKTGISVDTQLGCHSHSFSSDLQTLLGAPVERTLALAEGTLSQIGGGSAR